MAEFIASTIIWLIAASIVGIFGRHREIGFWGAFAFSVFLSPLGGVIAVATSKTNTDIAREEQMLEMMKIQANTLSHIYEHYTKDVNGSLMAQLKQLQSEKLEGKWSDEDYESQRAKLLGL